MSEFEQDGDAPDHGFVADNPGIRKFEQQSGCGPRRGFGLARERTWALRKNFRRPSKA